MGGPGGGWFANTWDARRPLSTPSGLDSYREALQTLEATAARVEKDFGAIDVPFGEIYRLRLGGKDLPSRVTSVYYGTVADAAFTAATMACSR